MIFMMSYSHSLICGMRVLLFPLVPAQITIRPNDMTLADTGSTVIVTCVGFGLEPPNIMWTRGDQVLSNDSRYTIIQEMIVEGEQMFTQSFLEICSLEVGDSDSYGCTAINSAGNDTATFVLTVEEPGMYMMTTCWE